MLQNERAPSFVMVTCSCGRSLRAKAEQIGSEVRCWDCHKMVLVPSPWHRQQLARELSDGALEVIKGPDMNSIMVGAAIMTSLLAIRGYGVWCALMGFTLGGIFYYGETIRRLSQGPAPVPDSGSRPWLSPGLIPRLIISLAMAAGTVLPLWWLNSGLHRSPHWSTSTRAIAAGTWIIGPILMFLVCARTGDNKRIGVIPGLKSLARHPVATSLALAMVPFSLVLAEVALTLVIYFTGNLPFYALDYMPMPTLAGRNELPVMYGGIPHYRMTDYRVFPASMFEEGYIDGISHGYSFVAAMPASLSLQTRAGMDAVDAIGLIGPGYPIVRLLFVLTIVTILLAGFAIQAHWLGSIPALHVRRSATVLTSTNPPLGLNPIGS